MPAKKRVAESESEDEDVKPQVKKRETKPKAAAKEASEEKDEGEVSKNEEGDQYLKLSDTRRVTVRSFKGKTLIDIREYYKDKDGEMKPGKKGVSLTSEQWAAMAGKVDVINDMIKAKA